MRVRQFLGERIRDHGTARIARDAFDDSSVFGFPLRMSRELVLVQQAIGPRLDDLVILRCSDISEILLSQADLLLEEALKQVTPYPVRVPNLNLRSWQTVCTGLAAGRTVVEVVDELSGSMEVGRVLRAGREELTLQRLGMVERKRDKQIRIPYREVTRIQLPVRHTTNWLT